jgi:hypothetical protein
MRTRVVFAVPMEIIVNIATITPARFTVDRTNNSPNNSARRTSKKETGRQTKYHADIVSFRWGHERENYEHYRNDQLHGTLNPFACDGYPKAHHRS